MFYDELSEETQKIEYHQVQLNKLYEEFIREMLNEIEGRTNTSLANTIVSIIRNRDKYTDEEIISRFRDDKYTDYSPWFTDDYPYKLFILLAYYDWREYYKQNHLLINYVTGKNLDEDKIKD